jgi:rhodanese-related sulfurtransferase
LGDAREVAPSVTSGGSPEVATDALCAEDVSLDADRLAWLLDTDDVAVLDVRDGAPRSGGVPGSATWAPGEAVPGDRVVVIVDEVGGRAPQLALGLRAAGVEAWALTGGLAAWRRAGHPVEGLPS